MKKLLFFLALILFFSCERLDDTFCWQCIKTSFILDLQFDELFISIDTVPKCDYSEKDAQSFENRFRIPKTVRGTCGSEIVWMNCICEKTNK